MQREQPKISAKRAAVKAKLVAVFVVAFPTWPEMQAMQAVKDLSLLQKEKPKQKRLGILQSSLQRLQVPLSVHKNSPHVRALYSFRRSKWESEEECWQTAGFDTQLDAGLVHWPRRGAAKGGSKQILQCILSNPSMRNPPLISQMPYSRLLRLGSKALEGVRVISRPQDTADPRFYNLYPWYVLVSICFVQGPCMT